MVILKEIYIMCNAANNSFLNKLKFWMIRLLFCGRLHNM